MLVALTILIAAGSGKHFSLCDLICCFSSADHELPIPQRGHNRLSRRGRIPCQLCRLLGKLSPGSSSPTTPKNTSRPESL